jgi:hypothetical protein
VWMHDYTLSQEPGARSKKVLQNRSMLAVCGLFWVMVVRPKIARKGVIVARRFTLDSLLFQSFAQLAAPSPANAIRRVHPRRRG